MGDQHMAAMEATKRRIAKALEEMRKLSRDDRMEVMYHFCRECGSDDPHCQCWNDE